MIQVTFLTMTDATAQEPLDSEQGDRLIGFARTCAVAVRAVSLYPAKHPAVDAALARLVDCVTTITANEALRATVLPHTLLIDGRAPAKADPALAELATALHLHRISGLTVRNAGDASMWQQLLGLVGRPTDEIREAGGIGHLWSESGGITTAAYLRSVEVREVDYEQLLRNQALGDPLTLEEIFDRLESGTPEAMGSAAQALLAEIVADAEKLELFGVKLAERCGDRAAHANALTHLLRQAVDVAGGAGAGSRSESLRNLAELLTGLDAPTLAELLRRRDSPAADGQDPIQVVTDLVEPQQVVDFVSESIVADGTASQRLAEAFQALVPDIDDRRKLVSLAGDQIAESPFGQTDSFPNMWQQAESLLTSYSDEQYVSEEYASELGFARTQATEVEQVSDDPPERIASWLSTVDDPSLRSLDSQLLLDLLTLETDPHRWRDIAETVCAHVDTLTRTGGLEWAGRFTEALAVARADDAAASADDSIAHFAKEACEQLAAGAVVGHALARLREGGDDAVPHVKRLCATLGPRVVASLAKALAADGDAGVRRTARDILLAFGADGRSAVKQLLDAPDWEVRQTAAFLLREFTGGTGLDELKRLLADPEPQVQREAIRAMIQAADERAYEVLVAVLRDGDADARASVGRQLTAQRDARVVPLCRYLLSRLDGQARRDVQVAVIDTLGAVGGESAVEPLRDALYEGSWRAPFRTRSVRLAAAQALRRIRSESATQVLRDAAARGSWGVRAATRAKVVQIEGRI
jgi:HEAT repeat protein